MELWNFAPWYGDWGPTIYHHGSLNTNIPPMDYGVIFMLKGTDRINRKTMEHNCLGVVLVAFVLFL